LCVLMVFTRRGLPDWPRQFAQRLCVFDQRLSQNSESFPSQGAYLSKVRPNSMTRLDGGGRGPGLRDHGDDEKAGLSFPAALVGSRAAAAALRDRVRCQVGCLDQIANSPRELVGETMRAVFEDQ
jgi:hypothetical protein